MIKKILFIGAAVILFYAILGFFIIPTILKPKLISGLEEQLGLQCSVDEIEINPFYLSVTIRNFKINEPTGTHLLGFKELFVNFQISSVFHKAYKFHSIHLIAPDGQIRIGHDGKMNISCLSSAKEQAEPSPDQKNTLPHVMVEQLTIQQGRLKFIDLSRADLFETTLFPIDFTLNNFTTQQGGSSTYSFTASGEKGEHFSWDGGFNVTPVQSNGKFNITGIHKRKLWEYVQDRVVFEVQSGSFDLAAKYNVVMDKESVQVYINGGEITLSDFVITEKGNKEPLINIPLFTIHNANVDLSRKSINIDSVKSNGARFEALIDPEGHINLHRLLLVDEDGKKRKRTTDVSDQKGIQEEPWDIMIKDLEFVNYGVALENQTFANPLRTELESLCLKVQNLTNKRDSQTDAGLNFKINRTGFMDVKGSVGINPVSAQLITKVENLDLKPFQRILDPIAQLDFLGGIVNLDGNLRYGKRNGKEASEMRFDGSVHIDDFEVVDRIQGKDLLKWDSLSVRGIAVDVFPGKLKISDIIISKPSAGITIFPDGTVNINTVFSPKKEDHVDSNVISQVTPMEEDKPKSRTPIPIEVDSIRFEKASIHFTDLSIEPNAKIGILNLDGSIKGFKSESADPTDISFKGKIDKHGLIRIQGEARPLGQDIYTDLALSLHNIKLNTFSPYSGKFIGNTIKKGKMTVNLKYKLSKNILTGRNAIVLDQFTLGNATNSPDATTVPVKLAIALLKDSKGIINIDFPIYGNVNDPKFLYGRPILTALRDIIINTTVSPFAALGKIVGGSGEALSHVDFEFGSPDLLSEQISKLDSLAQALLKRPNLRIEIKGVSDPHYDKFAMGEKELTYKLKLMKFKQMRKAEKKITTRVEDVYLSDDEYSRLLMRACEDAFSKGPGDKKDVETAKLLPSEPVDLSSACKQKLIESISVDETAQRAIAEKRAMNIKDYLIVEGGIADEQVLVTGTEIVECMENNKIRVRLGVSGK